MKEELVEQASKIASELRRRREQLNELEFYKDHPYKVLRGNGIFLENANYDVPIEYDEINNMLEELVENMLKKRIKELEEELAKI